MKNMESIERLPQGTLRCLDGDDFMRIINKLLQQKENLQNEIRKKTIEIDTYVQGLQATSLDDIRELFEALSYNSEYTVEQTKLLQDYHNTSKEMRAYSHLGNCHVYLMEGGDMLLKFISSPANKSSTKLLICLTTTPDNAYSVKHHDLPDSIPVAKLEEKYLENKTGTEVILKQFTTSIHQYTWPLFHRLSQIQLLEKHNMGETKHVYRNEGITLITFNMVTYEDEKSFTFEFVLKYHPRDIFPYDTRAELISISNERPNAEIQESMDYLALEMQAKPFYEVISSSLGRLSEDQGYQQRDSESGSSSGSTTLFEMF